MAEPERPSAAADAPPDAAARDAILAELVDGVLVELRRGGVPDLDALTAAHPDLAGELRWLFGAVLAAEVAAPLAEPATEVTVTTNAAERDIPRRFGQYVLLRELGRGGMGAVYEAQQENPSRTVALKMILKGALAMPADRARFRAEAQHAAQLDHPHVVPVFEVGEVDGAPYFTMKYVAGTTLAERLAEGPLPPREAAALLLPACRAIQYAHERGLLHRDLKPSNILLDSEGRPHVSDFGLARRVAGGERLTLSGEVLGTPSHMAPEQAAARGALGPACDVYSLGSILYEMLTGRPPFQSVSPIDTLLMVLEQEPLPPRLLNPRIDADLELIALRCLQKPPDLRYATAGALADDLAAYLADEPIAARSGAFAQVIARWFRETHHATVLENWGLLWMWHSLALFALAIATSALAWLSYRSPWPYLALWTAGLGGWAAIFWALRRRAGPVTFVERQVAHVWAASMIGIALLFVVEILLGWPVLSLSPLLAVLAGMVFFIKAGMLSGRFYIQALVLFATAPAMAIIAQQNVGWGVALFGAVAAACFFVPGWRYYRRRVPAAAKP